MTKFADFLLLFFVEAKINIHTNIFYQAKSLKKRLYFAVHGLKHNTEKSIINEHEVRRDYIYLLDLVKQTTSST